jgi:rfaE bifunctional protein kinase chain/domain
MNITKNRVNEIKKNFVNKKIAVIGDMMLDSYTWGDVKRISPEAPVPVVEVKDEFNRFGGAANVAYNILKLGGIPYPVGVIGSDIYGDIFLSLLSKAEITSEGLVIDSKRPTTAKIRVIASDQHLVRIDKESKESVTREVQNKIYQAILKNIDQLDGIILQDYNKGVLTPSLIKKIITLANRKKKLITVDPKFNNFFSYKNVTVFKPNRKEAEDVLGIKIKDEKGVNDAGAKLLSKLNAKYILLTLSEEGIAVFEKGKPARRMPTKARKVADVSGAGDTVISTLTIALSAGADIMEATYLANYAGGLVCEEVGIVPIELDVLFETVKREIL